MLKQKLDASKGGGGGRGVATTGGRRAAAEQWMSSLSVQERQEALAFRSGTWVSPQIPPFLLPQTSSLSHTLKLTFARPLMPVGQVRTVAAMLEESKRRGLRRTRFAFTSDPPAEEGQAGGSGGEEGKRRRERGEAGRSRRGSGLSVGKVVRRAEVDQRVAEYKSEARGRGGEGGRRGGGGGGRESGGGEGRGEEGLRGLLVLAGGSESVVDGLIEKIRNARRGLVGAPNAAETCFAAEKGGVQKKQKGQRGGEGGGAGEGGGVREFVVVDWSPVS